MNIWDARILADRLMAEHGLCAAGWKFRWDRATRRFGSCHHTRRTISLSLPLVRLNSESQVRDTMLHEIAHALTPGDGHGRRWKDKCRQIGARPVRCFTQVEVILPEKKKSPPRVKVRKTRQSRLRGWLAAAGW